MRYFFPLLFVCLFGQLHAIDASLSYARFYSPQDNYIEIYLHVSGQTVTPVVQEDSLVQGGVNVLILFQQGEEVVKFDRFRLNSPFGERVVDFVDLKRYALANGDYSLAVLVEDVADSTNIREYRTDISIDFATSAVEQSDIQLLASARQAEQESAFTKSGVLCEPLPYHFYGRGANVLSFYHEVYHSDTFIQDAFVATYKVDQLNKGEGRTVLIGHKRQAPASVNPLLIQMDISDLPSGNYRLAVEVRDRERQLISTRSVFFQRANPLVDAERLEEALAQLTVEDEFVGQLTEEEVRIGLLAIIPHLPQNDVEVVDLLIRNDSVRSQRTYLYSFWAKENRAAPQLAYEQYMEVVRAVDAEFRSGFRNGFETDRGYVYLKYGQPNDIVRNENEPSAPPYEIWSYDKIDRTNQNNVRFIFYNPSLAAGDFVLLHSDVIGERQNPQWQLQLYRAAPGDHPDDYFMGTDVEDNIGRNATRLLRNY